MVGEASFDGKRYAVIQWQDDSFDGSYEFKEIKDAR